MLITKKHLRHGPSLNIRRVKYVIKQINVHFRGVIRLNSFSSSVTLKLRPDAGLFKRHLSYVYKAAEGNKVLQVVEFYRPFIKGGS